MLDCDNPFWNFSLAIYGAPGVASECLALQSELNIDVNILLYVAWLGSAHKIKLTDENMMHADASVRRWRDMVVRPLRAVRQGIKVLPDMADDAVKDFRSEIARAELRAEQIEQAMLFKQAGELVDTETATTIAEAVHHNVTALLKRNMLTAGTAGEEPPKAARLIAEAIAYR